MSIKEVFVPGIGRKVKLQHRNGMKARASHRSFRFPTVPATTLPVDSTGNGTVVLGMFGNNQYGDCGEAMVAHCDNILTYRQGKGAESTFTDAALIAQYLKVSGGDNGLDEDMVVNQIWKVGIAGNPAAVIVDSLDVDVTNVPLTQFAIDNFYTVQMAWSVPDNFLQNFAHGTVWAGAGVPDPNNGHYTPLADVLGPNDSANGVSLNGFYRLITWGDWCYVSPAFVASVQPQCFIAFSPRQFDPKTGLDSKGRHITAQAALWEKCGGHPIPQSVIAQFPPVGPTPAPTPTPTPAPTPTPTPTPVPTPPPAPTPAQVIALVDEAFAVIEKYNPRWAPFLKIINKDVDNLIAHSGRRAEDHPLKLNFPDLVALAKKVGLSVVELLELIETDGPAVLNVIQQILNVLPPGVK